MKPLVLVAVLELLGATAPAEDSLGRGIPSDYFLYIRRKANPEREFLSPALEGLGRALREANLIEALLEPAGGDAKPADREAARQEALEWRRVVEGVRWGRLLRKECAFGLRFDLSIVDSETLDASSRTDWILLFRVEPGERDGILLELRRLVLALGTLEDVPDAESGRRGRFEVIEADREGAPTTMLVSQSGQTRLCASGQGDVVSLASSSWEMRRAFQLLAGEGSGIGVPDTEDFAAAFQGLPAPEDGEALLRPGLIFEQLRRAAEIVEKTPLRDAQLAEDAEAAVRALKGLLETFDLIKAVAASETTEGERLVKSIRIALQDQAPSRALHGALFGRPEIGSIDRLVPGSVSSFSVVAGPDFSKLHDVLVEFVEKVVPGGRLLMDEYRRAEERSGFDFRRDVLGLIEGRCMVLGFPRAGAAPAGDWVLLLKLKDPARAGAKISEWIESSAEKLQALGLKPERVDLPDVPPPASFQRIAPPLLPGLEVFFGVGDTEFVAGTSLERIREALLVRSGKVKGFRENPGAAAIEIPAGAGLGAAFSGDLGALRGELQRILPWISAASGAIPEEVLGFPLELRGILRIAPKLGPVLDALGFAESCGGALWKDGAGYRGKFILKFREPPSPAVRPGGDRPKEEKKAEEKKSEKSRRTF